MSAKILIIDLFALVLMVCGFTLAFRQSFVRRLLGWSPPAPVAGAGDAATYVLRIAGVMIMAFGFALGMMMTLFSLA